MSLPSNWRQLQLFDIVPIRDPNYNSDDALYSHTTLTAISSTEKYMVISIDNCYLKIISQDFQSLKTFMAYDSDYTITYVNSIDQLDLIVTIAEKQGFPSVLKLWNLSKILSIELNENEDPDDVLKRKYQTQVMIQNGDNSFPISCFIFNDDFSCISVGYTNGKVLLIRGDLIRDRGSKQRIIYETPDPITGLQFNEYHELIYVTTTSKILTVATTGRNQGKPLKILSKQVGVPLQCSTKDKSTQELIVGTDSSLRYYNHFGKSHIINFEIKKKIIYRFKKNYLLMVSPEENSTGNSRKQTTKVIILDLHNKHISFTVTLPNTTMNHILEMWGDIYLLSSDGMLYKFHEKPINQQVEIILQRELFQLSYQIAKQSKLSPDILLRICKLHGDFLYNKQDYHESIKLFIKCLNYYKDPNLNLKQDDETLNDFIINIITKFKDASNINNLTEFLNQLYKLDIANNDHITLLLCCYCKLKSVDKIKTFINELDLTDEDESNELASLDFPLIINLFKECGYFHEVIKLLHKLNRPSLIVDIQLNDLKSPKKCLKYIKTLPIDDLLLILIEHSKTLLDNLPIETTELLINVFTGKYTAHDSNVLNEQIEEKEKEPVSDSSFPISSYQNFLAYLSNNAEEPEEEPVDNGPTYLPPRPSLIFASFMNNPHEFVVFLEACIETFDKYQGNINDKKELLITLFEMYLSLSKKSENSEWLDKAQGVIDDNSEFLDESTILLISHIYNFKPGELSSKKRQGFEESLFRSAQLVGDIDECLKIVNQYGDSKPELYKFLLRFIVSKQQYFDKVSDKDFKFILNKIKDYKLSTPLEIIQILSSTEFTTIGLIKDYLIEIIDSNNQEINNNEKLVELYEKESINNNHELNRLKSKPFIIQNNKCSACNLNLDFPAIHFKCKHSFHQRCLNDNYLSSNEHLNSKPVCSICISDIDLIQTLRDEQLKSKDETDLFKSTLKESSDKFKVITNYIGKGIMENEFIHITD